MGVETIPSIAVSGIASGIESGISSAGSNLASIGESSLSSLGSTFRSLPDAGGSFIPGFTVEGLKGLPEMSFGDFKPNLDTLLPFYQIGSDGIFTFSQNPENLSLTINQDVAPLVPFEFPTINLQPESEAIKPFISLAKKLVPESIVSKTNPAYFHAEFLQYPTLAIPSFTENDTDEALVGKIRSFIETSAEFSAEEKLLWKQKLRTALEQKISAEITTEEEVETVTETKTEPQTLTVAQMETPPPSPPTTANLSELQPEDEADEDDENEWKVYSVEPKWVVAKNILKQRTETVNQAVLDSTGEFSLVDSVRGKIAGLDIPNPDQSIKIATGELVLPQVVAKIDHALDFVDGDDIQEIASTAQEIVRKNAPHQKNKLVRFIEKVKQSRLVKPARIFADLGAKYIVLRKATMQWEARKKLARTEPIELEKVKKNTTRTT